MDCLWTTLPLVDLNMLILLFTTKWLLWMPGMTLMDFDDSSRPQLIWIPFVFSSQSPLYCSQLLNFSRSVEDFNLIYQGFWRLNQCSSVFDNPPCSEINSHISQIMSIQSLVCWNEIRDVLFENLLKIKLFDQRPNTRYSKYIVLWLSCILKTEIDPM